MKTKTLVKTSMLSALCLVATAVIKLPSPIGGYINLGDCTVLLSGFMLSPMYGFLAAGIGSALADIFLGYALYAPVTFVIKGLMALLVSKMGRKRLLGGVLAEILMVLGYYVFEGFLYGFGASLINIPANAVQGTVGLILGLILYKGMEKIK